MTVGAWVLLVGAVVALAVGLLRLATDGRFRGTREIPRHEAPGSANEKSAESLLPPEQLGERATLLQFSSAFCAPCRATRRTLADVAERVPGVAHVEIDAEAHLDLVRRLNILRT